MKKLMTLVLVLALCLSLAGSAFAEQLETEVPAPGEQTGTLPVEENAPVPEETAPPDAESAPKEETSPEDTARKAEDTQDISAPAIEDGAPEGMPEDVFIYGHIHFLEEHEEENGEMVQYGYLCYDASCPYLQGSQAADILSVTADSSLANCSVCGRRDWGPEVLAKTFYFNTGDPTTHEKQDLMIRYCQTAECTGIASRGTPRKVVAHSWTRGSATGNYSDQGSTHATEYTYTCVCGYTKTDTETEDHDLNKLTFGSNYHKGVRHYVEWECVCRNCGCRTIKVESYECPGSPSGVGCVFPISRVDPPVEVQDAAAPEDTIPPGPDDIQT